MTSIPGVTHEFEAAVSSAALPDVERLLLASPELHALKFWHGLTPLHLACLRASNPAGAARLLISHGADVNAKNAFGETPLMFACKRGVPELVAVLIQAGADMQARDRGGRGVMHHVAVGGSVSVTDFLHTVLGVSCKDVDDRRQTPLHIISSMGHIELFRYLLRKPGGVERVELQAADIYGNTALHVAASNGHTKIVWELLLTGGKGMVLFANKDGRTPLDLAQQQNTYKHRDTLLVLRHARDLCSTKAEFRGPSAAWCWHLVMPACVVLVAVGTARLLQDSFGGLSGIGCLTTIMLALLATVYRHSHRMEHVCDWPNPIYAGCFAGGLLLTLARHILLLWTNIGNLAATAVFTVVIVTALLCSYYQLLIGDPGFVKASERASNGDAGRTSAQDREKAISEAASGLWPNADQWCSVCEAYQDENTKHCRLCDRCLVYLDHHCLYLMKCIARDNHRLFVAFVVLVLLSQLTFLTAACSHVLQAAAELPPTGGATAPDIAVLLTMVIREELSLTVLFILNAVSVVWGLSVLKWQLRLVAQGQTHYMSAKAAKSDEVVPQLQLSIQDQVTNVVHFVKGLKPYRRASQWPECDMA